MEHQEKVQGMSELTRQQAVDELKIVDTPPEERFDRITRLAKELFGVETAAVTIIDHDRQWFKSRAGTSLVEGDRRAAFCDFTIRKPEVLNVADASKDFRFSDNPLVLGDPNIRFYAGYPLEAPSGENVGALCIFDPNPREFSAKDEELLKDLALWVTKEMMIEKELSRAEEVQQTLLPKKRAGLNGYDSAGGCKSARTVGGDFYDWYDVEGGEVFTLVDVMGKGMGSAIIAATVRAVLRSGSRSADIVQAVEVAAMTLDSDLNNLGSFATLFHAQLDTDSGHIRFIDAGHGLSMVLRADGSKIRLVSENPPLGMGIGTVWEEQSFELNPGDTLVSVSDGVLDLFDGKLSSLEKIEEIVRNSESAQVAVQKVLALAGSTAPDDVTILVIRRSD